VTGLFGIAVLGACAAAGEPQVCDVNADCASLVCRPDGTCAPIPDGGDDTGVGADVSPMGDATADADLDGGIGSDGAIPDAALPGCTPNHDGIIARAEVPLMAGLRATFRAATDVTVSTAGEDLGDGRRRWDLSGDLSGDHAVLVETLAPDAYWFAEDFPEASYVSRLTESEDLLGVFQITPSELALLGVVSPEDGFTATNVSHDPPVSTLRFPLERGDSWAIDARVSGMNLGVVAFWDEAYSVDVDAEGELVAPFGTFEVLRVAVVLERTVGLLTTTTRSFLFVSECFGTVATITSQQDERRAEFTEAAEVRRLAP
jgi:hypothetical protein